MADTYVQLSYEEWKALEETCRAFKETTHGEGTPWYHKSFRLPVGGVTWEFHAPMVKARMAEEEGGVPYRELLEAERERTAEQRQTIEDLTQRIAQLRDDQATGQKAEEGG